MKELSAIDSLTEMIDRRFKYVEQFIETYSYDHRGWILEIKDLYKFLLDVEYTKDIINRLLIDLYNEQVQFFEAEDIIFKEMKELYLKIKDRYTYDDSYYSIGEESIFFSSIRSDREDIHCNYIPIEIAINFISNNYFYENSPIINDSESVIFNDIKKKSKSLILKYQDLSIIHGSSFLFLENLLLNVGLIDKSFITEINGNEIFSGLSHFNTLEKEKIDKLFVSRGKLLDKIILEIIKKQLHRLHLGLIKNIGKSLLYEQLILKYKARCEIYDKERVLKIIDTEEKKYELKEKGKKEVEKVICKDMAAYLFDNGLPVFSEVIAEDFRFDVFSNYRRDFPLLIEAKQYNKSVSDKEVLSWYDQIFNYMNVLFGDKYLIKVGYLIVFRVEGPLYHLPETITIGNLTVNTIVVNLGSREGGQSTINREDIKLSVEKNR